MKPLPQGIDRAAFLALLDELSDGDDDRMFDQDDLYQGLLALVRPVEGVTLTPEERQAFETADIVLRHYGYQPTADLLSAVVARLETPGEPE